MIKFYFFYYFLLYLIFIYNYIKILSNIICFLSSFTNKNKFNNFIQIYIIFTYKSCITLEVLYKQLSLLIFKFIFFLSKEFILKTEGIIFITKG